MSSYLFKPLDAMACFSLIKSRINLEQCSLKLEGTGGRSLRSRFTSRPEMTKRSTLEATSGIVTIVYVARIPASKAICFPFFCLIQGMEAIGLEVADKVGVFELLRCKKGRKGVRSNHLM